MKSHKKTETEKTPQVTWDWRQGHVNCQVTWLKTGDRKQAQVNNSNTHVGLNPWLSARLQYVQCISLMKSSEWSLLSMRNAFNSTTYAISVSTNDNKRKFILTFLQNYSAHKGFNTLRPRQNERHFADDVFKLIFLNENVRISIDISLKFVPKDQINNIPSLVQIMAWRRPGDKPLSEAMLVSSLTHICVTLPQWVNCIVSSTHLHQEMPYLSPDNSTCCYGHFCAVVRFYLNWVDRDLINDAEWCLGSHYNGTQYDTLEHTSQQWCK